MATPSDIQLQQINLQRQQALADALRQQSMQSNTTEMVSGRAIPQGLLGAIAPMLRAGMANNVQGKVNTGNQDLVSALQQKRQDWIGSMPKETQQVGSDGMGPPQTIQPAANDYMTWALKGAEIDPQLMTAGMGMVNQNENRQQREFLAKQSSADRMAQQEAAQAAAMEQQRERLAAQAEMKRQHDETLRAMKAAGGGGNPYFTPVQTANGVFAFDARKGALTPLDVGGHPVIGSASDPALQGKISAAKTGGEAQAKRDFNMGGVTDLVSQADSILKGKEKPTHSTIGNLIDSVASIIGQTPSGAAQADQLRVIGGALVSKMPRMEGPQSDKDVALYREMAGNVANANLPIKRRIAALDQVKQIVSKYDKTSDQSGIPDQSAIDAEMKRRGL